MKGYNYILEKIQNAEFSFSPFKHLYIKDFLSNEHIKILTSSPQINLPLKETSKELIEELFLQGYEIQKFPGCIEDVNLYLKYLEEEKFPVQRSMLESFGITFRLKKYNDPKILEIVNFLNSDIFKKTLEEKFSIDRSNKIETAIQKNLTGYEISPHPDVRFKCLTYLININTDEKIQNDKSMHTHLLKFKEDKKYIQNFWENNPSFNTDWVPWDYCETKKICKENNSLVMFKPSNDTLHAVKLNYDHLKYQRTQLYGNLWYTDSWKVKKLRYNQIPTPV